MDAVALVMRDTPAARELVTALANGSVGHLMLDGKTFEARAHAALVEAGDPAAELEDTATAQRAWLLPPVTGEVFPFTSTEDSPVGLPGFRGGPGSWNRCYALGF